MENDYKQVYYDVFFSYDYKKGMIDVQLDYVEIGRRIARRRRELGLKQSETEEKAGIGYKYLSNIERGISIPSTEVVMRLAEALDTTPDEFLVGTSHDSGERWLDIAQKLRSMNDKQLDMADSFLSWLKEQEK